MYDTLVLSGTSYPIDIVKVSFDGFNSYPNLPANFTYACDPPSCSFLGGTSGCIEIFAPSPPNWIMSSLYIYYTTSLLNVPGNNSGSIFFLTDTIYDYGILISGNTPTESWDCNNGVCNDPGTGSGQYSTLAACTAVCVVSAIQEQSNNKELLKVTDLLGRETKGTKNELLFYIYDDGTVEKRIVVE